jgi:hypothetical protein
MTLAPAGKVVTHLGILLMYIRILEPNINVVIHRGFFKILQTLRSYLYNLRAGL